MYVYVYKYVYIHIQSLYTANVVAPWRSSHWFQWISSRIFNFNDARCNSLKSVNSVRSSHWFQWITSCIFNFTYWIYIVDLVKQKDRRWSEGVDSDFSEVLRASVILHSRYTQWILQCKVAEDLKIHIVNSMNCVTSVILHSEYTQWGFYVKWQMRGVCLGRHSQKWALLSLYAQATHSQFRSVLTLEICYLDQLLSFQRARSQLGRKHINRSTQGDLCLGKNSHKFDVEPFYIANVVSHWLLRSLTLVPCSSRWVSVSFLVLASSLCCVTRVNCAANWSRSFWQSSVCTCLTQVTLSVCTCACAVETTTVVVCVVWNTVATPSVCVCCGAVANGAVCVAWILTGVLRFIVTSSSSSITCKRNNSRHDALILHTTLAWSRTCPIDKEKEKERKRERKT